MPYYNALKTFEKTSPEYKTLTDAADALNQQVKNVRYTVEDTYFDFGQNWMYTTIIAHRLDRDADDVTAGWQALTPRDQERILFMGDNERQAVIAALADKHNSRYANTGRELA